MIVMAPIRPTQQPALTRNHHATLPAGPHTVAEARKQVRTAVRTWHVPVDIDVAVLLTSELVTNAITHGRVLYGGGTVTLIIHSGEGQLRVEVYDTSFAPPVPGDSVPADAEHGRGLQLVDSLSTTWGSYPTATGKAVYFTLGSGSVRHD
jgi:anti-sigma regulatory factor (Ser/Thr protein kinase)